jgi:hypothetical protein
MYVEWSYAIYLIVSVVLTVWVARTLSRNGRVFLVEAFNGHAEMADSVNRLLVVGFYLINIGYVTLALRYGNKPTDLKESIEFLSTKVGLVLLILGAMHFFNLMVFSRMRRAAIEQRTLEAIRPIGPAPAVANATVEALRQVREA